MEKRNLPKIKTELRKIWKGNFISQHFVLIHISHLISYACSFWWKINSNLLAVKKIGIITGGNAFVLISLLAHFVSFPGRNLTPSLSLPRDVMTVLTLSLSLPRDVMAVLTSVLNIWLNRLPTEKVLFIVVKVWGTDNTKMVF